MRCCTGYVSSSACRKQLLRGIVSHAQRLGGPLLPLPASRACPAEVGPRAADPASAPGCRNPFESTHVRGNLEPLCKLSELHMPGGGGPQGSPLQWRWRCNLLQLLISPNPKIAPHSIPLNQRRSGPDPSVLGGAARPTRFPPARPTRPRTAAAAPLRRAAIARRESGGGARALRV